MPKTHLRAKVTFTIYHLPLLMCISVQGNLPIPLNHDVAHRMAFYGSQNTIHRINQPQSAASPRPLASLNPALSGTPAFEVNVIGAKGLLKHRAMVKSRGSDSISLKCEVYWLPTAAAGCPPRKVSDHSFIKSMITYSK